MAENIRIHLEEAINDFSYLHKKDIFTETQISRILKDREDLEYKMAKLKSKAIDFLESIEYEIKWVHVIFGFNFLGRIKKKSNGES